MKHTYGLDGDTPSGCGKSPESIAPSCPLLHVPRKATRVDVQKLEVKNRNSISDVIEPSVFGYIRALEKNKVWPAFNHLSSI